MIGINNHNNKGTVEIIMILLKCCYLLYTVLLGNKIEQHPVRCHLKDTFLLDDKITAAEILVGSLNMCLFFFNDQPTWWLVC